MGSNILLALGSLVMFATFLGSSNRLLIGNTQIASQNEYYIAALSYAQSVIDEAKTKKFDAGVPQMRVSGTTVKLTGVADLGTEGLVAEPNFVDGWTSKGYTSTYLFDDVDDYNGYHRQVNSPRAEGYELFTNVYYVDPSNPDKVVSSTTRCKKMIVKITSPFFPKIEKNGVEVQDTLKISYVFTQ